MKRFFLFLILPGLLITGCTQVQQTATGGALLGAAAGAAIGNHHSSGRRDKGALIGAVVGGLAGTAIGQSQELKKQQGEEQIIVICPSCDSKVDVTGFPPHSTVECPNCRARFTY